MIIDAHTHVYAWPKIVPESRKDGTTFMSMEKQIAFMDEMGIDKAVILPLNNAEAPAELQSLGEVLYICESYPNRFIPFCNVDPRLPRAPEKIDTAAFLPLLEQYRSHGCKGLGELTARLRWDHPSMLALLGACEAVGFPITFHTVGAEVDSYGVVDNPGLPGLERALAKFPKLRFIGHSPGFWSEISGGAGAEEKGGYPDSEVRPGGVAIRLFREYPNLYADLSAGSGYNALARDPDFTMGFLREFGDRVFFFGLDCNKPGCRTELLALLKTAGSDGVIDDNQLDNILAGNIQRVLGL